MSARPNVDRRPFNVDMNVPMSTARSPSQGMDVGGVTRVGAVAPEPAVGARGIHQRLPSRAFDSRLDRHAGHESIGEAVRIVDHDLYGDALHDFGEIARRIVGRQ